MNFLNPYSRNEYKDFFQNKLLTDDFEFVEEKLSLEFKPQYLKQVELLGRDKSLELDVYEILHESENDPRVGLSKEIFRLMSKYGAKRALAILYSPNSKNYRLSLATVELSLDGSKVKREYSNPRRYSFFLGPDAKVHTPYDFLIKKGRVKDFDDLQNRFSIEVVNKEFYKEIANWYFWALKKVIFPDDAETEKNGKEISVIRLITRLIFIWFMKVRKLVPEELFDENSLKDILTDLKISSDNYYKAILQNLFFATLNTKQNDRRFTSKKKGYKGFSQDFGNHNVYRYEESFKTSEEVIEKYFLPIPFLNGGLFECLDYKTKTRDERKYIDGFTSTKSQQPVVPNYLFFSADKTENLNKDYGTSNKTYYVRGLINTLSLYNFTIDESDPNDADVALDPELLGKVFENLLASYNPETAKTARKSTGSYYTPRPIVDYMVDESLKQYFKTHMQLDDIDSKLGILFSGEDQSNPFDSMLTKRLVNLIDSLRVVDPAVGSGAFPMRILNRLVFLLHKLDPDNSLWKQSQIDGIKKSVKDVPLQRKFIEETERKFKEKNPNYGRKLYLIEKCIYGVDIQQIAVEIAKLRFFISLLVDEKVENGEIEPLPNLDFKLMQGNSLISSFGGIDFSAKSQNDNILFDFDETYKKLIEEFEELKSQYQNEPDVHGKRKLRDEIDAKLLDIFDEKLKQHYPQLKNLESKYGGKKEVIEIEKKKLFKKIGIELDKAEQDLIAYTEGRKQKDFFLWDVYFAEVFAEKGGFDIVIGNPPYGFRTVLTKDEKEYFRNGRGIEFSSGDSAELFCKLCFKEIVKEKGVLTFIIPKKSLYGDAWEDMRLNYWKMYDLLFILDTGKSFANVLLEAIVFGLSKSQENHSVELAFLENHSFINRFSNTTKEFFFLSNGTCQIYKVLYPKSLFEKVQNYSHKTKKVVTNLGLAIGKDFFSSKETKYKLLKGIDISRYVVRSHRWLKNYTKLKWESVKIFHKPKVVSQVIVAHIENPTPHLKITACIDYEGIAITNTLMALEPLDGIHQTFFLGYLNSKFISWYAYNFIYAQAIRTMHFYDFYIQQLPIPEVDLKAQQPIINLVELVIGIKQQKPQEVTYQLEAKIDIMVYKLYNLTYEEVQIIDPEIEKIISKKEYEKFIV